MTVYRLPAKEQNLTGTFPPEKPQQSKDDFNCVELQGAGRSLTFGDKTKFRKLLCADGEKYGRLEFRNNTFEAGVSFKALRTDEIVFRKCAFHSTADLSAVHARRVVFEDCIFCPTEPSRKSTGLNLEGATIDTLDISIAGAVSSFAGMTPLAVLGLDLGTVHVSRRLSIRMVERKQGEFAVLERRDGNDEPLSMPYLHCDLGDAFVEGTAEIHLFRFEAEDLSVSADQDTRQQNLASFPPIGLGSGHRINLERAVFRQALGLSGGPPHPERVCEVLVSGRGLRVEHRLTLDGLTPSILTKTGEDEVGRLSLLDLAHADLGHLRLEAMTADAIGLPPSRLALDPPVAAATPRGLHQALLARASVDPWIGDDGKSRNNVAQRAAILRPLAALAPESERRSLTRLAQALMAQGDMRAADSMVIAEKELALAEDYREMFSGWVRRIPWLGRFPVTSFFLCFGAFLGCVIYLFIHCAAAADPIAGWWTSSRIAALVFGFGFAMMLGTRLLKKPTSYPAMFFDWLVLITIRGGVKPLKVVGQIVMLWLFGVMGADLLANRGAMSPERAAFVASKRDWIHMELRYRGLHLQQDDANDAENDAENEMKAGTRGTVGPLAGPLDFVALKKSLSAVDEYGNGANKNHDFHDRLHLSDHFHACRHNWARPEAITPEKWVATLRARYAKRYCDGSGSNRWSAACRDRDKRVDEHDVWRHVVSSFRPELRGETCAIFLPAEYSTFSPWLYSADVVIPLLDLRQEKDWSIRVTLPDLTTGRYDDRDISEAQGTKQSDLPDREDDADDATGEATDGSGRAAGTGGPGGDSDTSSDRARSAFNEPILAVAMALEALMVLTGWMLALVLAGAITGLSDPRRRPY